jgi:hypothetical protein
MASGFRSLSPSLPSAARNGHADSATTIDALDPDQFLADAWDHEQGGRIGEQKFPEPALLWWLFDQATEGRNAAAASALQGQLDRMAAGGLFDPLHGGFFRYATRSDWGHPHFEKMLYTQSQLLALYARAGLYWDRPGWLAIALHAQQRALGGVGIGSCLFHFSLQLAHLGSQLVLLLDQNDCEIVLVGGDCRIEFRFGLGQLGACAFETLVEIFAPANDSRGSGLEFRVLRHHRINRVLVGNLRVLLFDVRNP